MQSEHKSRPSSTSSVAKSLSATASFFQPKVQPLSTEEKAQQVLEGVVKLILNNPIFKKVQDFDDYASALANLIEDPEKPVIHLPIPKQCAILISQLQDCLSSNVNHKNVILSLIKKHIVRLLHMTQVERKDNIMFWDLWLNRSNVNNEFKFDALLKKTKSEIECKNQYRVTSPHQGLLQYILGVKVGLSGVYLPDLSWIKKLLDWGVDPNIFIYDRRGSEFVSLLSYACRYQFSFKGEGNFANCTHEFPLMLIKAGAKLNFVEESEVVAALCAGNVVLSQLLLDNGLKINWSQSAIQMALDTSYDDGNIEMTRFLLRKGVKPRDEDLKRMLHKEDRPEMVGLLVEYKADAISGFHNALEHTRPLTIQYFFERNVAIPDAYKNLGNIAILSCSGAVLNLIRAGHAPNNIYNYKNNIYNHKEYGMFPANHITSPLIAAVREQYLATVKVLLENGADPNMTDQAGTPLHHALGVSWEGDIDNPFFGIILEPSPTTIEIIKLLLNFGAQTDIRNPKKYLPIDIKPLPICEDIFRKHQNKMRVGLMIVVGQAYTASQKANHFAKLSAPIARLICSFFFTPEDQPEMNKIFNPIVSKRIR